MEDIKNIYQRINQVMKEVTYVQKDKQVSGGGANYKAVTYDQLISTIRSSMVEHGIVIEVVQTNGEFLLMRDLNATPNPVKMGLYSGTYDIYLVNIDDPKDRFKSTVDAHASDNGDKAPGKALTYATKSALLKAFTLETGENEESRGDNTDSELIMDSQVNRLFEMMCNPDGTYKEIGDKTARKFNIGPISDIKSKDFSMILSYIEMLMVEDDCEKTISQINSSTSAEQSEGLYKAMARRLIDSPAKSLSLRLSRAYESSKQRIEE